MSRFARLRRGAFVAVAVAAAAPALASAGTIRLVPAPGGNVIEFEALPGEANTYYTHYSSNGIQGVADQFSGPNGIPIQPESPCFTGSPDGFYKDPWFASCPAADLVGIRVLLGDEMDEGWSGPGVGQYIRATIHGGSGPDRIGGGMVDDVLKGDDGADIVSGADGNDTLDGGPGPDTMNGGGGNDTLQAEDGERDSVDCGEGADSARVDAVDVTIGCETVNGVTPTSPATAQPPPTKPPSQAPDITGPRIVASPGRSVNLASVVARGLKVRVGCGEPCSVNLRLEIRRKEARRVGIAGTARIVIGRGSRKLPTAESARVTVRLTRKARQALRKVDRVRLLLRTSARDLAGNEAVTTRSFSAAR